MEMFKSALLRIALVSVLLSGSALAAIQTKPVSNSPCQCATKASFNSNLPESHPDNRCAVQQAGSVGWIDWLLGSSRSTQFHFVDLLELLSSDSNKSMNSHSSIDG